MCTCYVSSVDLVLCYHFVEYTQSAVIKSG